MCMLSSAISHPQGHHPMQMLSPQLLGSTPPAMTYVNYIL
jgi:hypothetical protein